MEVARSHFDIRANRKLLNAINTNISTLKCYNVDLSGPDGQDENSTFLIEMEEKTPHNTYIKWEEHKEKLKESGENITIDAFLEFYNKQINMEENAQYLRRPNRTDGRVPRSQEKAFVLQTKVSQDKKPFQRTRPQTSGSAQKKNKVRGSKGSNKWNKPGQKGGPSNTPTEGAPTQRYCIFCESPTHPTEFCKAGKHTA